MAQVLVVGSGGREHALCQQFQKSPQVTAVYCAPGNPGMALDGISLVAIGVSDFSELIAFVQKQKIDLTFVGPEVPLSQGIADAFLAANLPVFGPTQASAQLESSKSFAKAFLARHHIPTAASKTFTDLKDAQAYVSKQTLPVVIKVDGLAAGKGVTIAQSLPDALSVLSGLYEKRADQVVVIEQFLEGQEFSCMSFVHRDQIVMLPLSQDHKRLQTHDLGPNTGGMGAYSPLPQMPADLAQKAYDQVVAPTVSGMLADGLGFTGVLYAGLILTSTGIQVIEYNMRLGDPETQVLLPRLQSDFYQLLQDLLHQKRPVAAWKKEDVTLGVVVAADGYPVTPKQGIPIPDFSDLDPRIQLTYAGVKQAKTGLVSSGGRILMLTTTQKDVTTARSVVQGALEKYIQDPLIYRRDIGFKALQVGKY